jgi:hypothetical protein
VFEVYQLEAATAAKVAALDAAAFDQGSIEATWTESDQAISADGVSYATSHLSFAVIVSASPAVSNDSQASYRYARVRSRLLVEFLYHLRPGQQIADQRLAARAAADLRRAVMAPDPDANIVLFDAGRYSRTSDGEWLLVQVEFDAYHDLGI